MHALDFNGTSHYGTAPDHAAYDLTNFTIEAQVLLQPGQAGSRRLISQQDAAYWGLSFVDAKLGMLSSLDGIAHVTKGVRLDDGGIHDVAIVRDTVNDLALWYVDDVLVGSQAIASNAAYGVAALLSVGRYDAGASEFFAGAWRQLRLWSVARTAAQLADSRGRPIPPEAAGLVGYWLAHEGSGSAVKDLSSTANHLTLVNSPPRIILPPEIPPALLEVAWTSDPLDEVPVWDDATRYDLGNGESGGLRSFSSDRGRESALGRWEAGSGSVIVDNGDRRWEAFYSGSPWYPNVNRRKKLRLRTPWAEPILEMFIDANKLQYPDQGFGRNIAALQLTDGFRLFADHDLIHPHAYEVLKDSPHVYFRLNEAAGAALAIDSSANQRHAVIQGNPEFGVKSQAFADDSGGGVAFNNDRKGQIVVSSVAPFNWAGPFTFELFIDTALFPETSDVALIKLGGVPGQSKAGELVAFPTGDGSLTFMFIIGNADSIEGYVAFGDAFYLAVLRETDGTLRMRRDANEIASGPSTAVIAGPEITLGSFESDAGDIWIDEFAFYASRVSDARLAVHAAGGAALRAQRTDQRLGNICDQAAWPVSRRAIDVGESTLTDAGDWNGKKALEAIRETDETEQGAAFIDRAGNLLFAGRYAPYGARARTSTVQLTFGDGAGEIDFDELVLSDDDRNLINIANVDQRNVGTFRVISQPSIDAHGSSGTQTSAITLSDHPSAGQALGEWIIAHLSDPSQLVIESVVIKVKTDNAFQLLALELFDRVVLEYQIKRDGVDLGASIVNESLITRISHDASAEEWIMSIEFHPVKDFTFWQWGVSAWEDPALPMNWGM